MMKLLLLFFPMILLASLQKVSVQLEWKHQFEYAGFYAAIEQGYYKDIGLDVELRELETDMDIIEEVTSLKSTFGLSSSSLILHKLNSKPVVLIASYFKQNALALAVSKNIKTIHDLKGKKIMIMPAEVRETSVGAMLRENNILPQDYTIVKHDFNIDKFINGEVDAMSVFVSNQPFLLNKTKKQYTLINPAKYGIHFYDVELFTNVDFAIKNPKLIQDFALASKKGWEYAFAHKEETVDLIYNKYSKLKSKEALLFEATKTEQLFKTNTYEIGSILKEAISLNAVIYDKLGLVHQNTNIKKQLKNYTFKDLHDNLQNPIKFSNEEIKYLTTNDITMCIDPDWMPFEKFQDNKHIGMSADFFKIIENNLQKKITLVQTSSWPESIKFAKARKCDLYSLVMSTPKRKEYMNFTSPYLSVPLVLATKPHIPFIANVKDIKNKKIGVPKGYAFLELLKNKYPNINIVEVLNAKDGLEKVKDGALFGYIGTLATVGYLFQTDFTGELKIAGKFDETWELGIGVRNDSPILLSIMQKAVASVSDLEKRDILNKWVAIKYDKVMDETWVWEVLLAALIILLIISYWTRKLSILNLQLKIAKNKADEATKAKANFLATISHEIRTPMNSIIGMTYLIKETKLSPTQDDYVHKIQNSSSNLLTLINDILDFSKIEARKLEIQNTDFNLLETVNNVENLLMVKAYEKGLTLSTHYDDSISMELHGDELRLSQILTNLLSNAIKFTDLGGIQLHIKKNASIFTFSVSDTGIGLTDTQIENIFSSFTQADSSITRKYGGTGLGLAIAKELVELMGGRIWVESVFKKGTTFYFELELHDALSCRTKSIAVEKSPSLTQENINSPIEQEKLQELFSQLTQAVNQRRPQLCGPILSELDSYTMNTNDEKFYINIKSLIKKYKFQEAKELLDAS